MSDVMQYEEETKVLGIPLTLKMIMHSQREFTIVGIRHDGKFHNLFVYRSDIDALQADEAEVSKLADDYARQVNNVLKGIIVVSDAVVWFVTTVMTFISSIFGGFIGFGLIGILIVIAMMLTIVALWIYAFFIIAPLMVISFGLKAWLNAKKEEAVKQLSQNALAFARRCILDLDRSAER